jgi:NAD(P)-dependent dehydrogenase (short-subunit alcohol dehydrogenase family)
VDDDGMGTATFALALPVGVSDDAEVAGVVPAVVAPAVLFLASAAARYVTGAVLPVDGGTSASTGQPHG